MKSVRTTTLALLVVAVSIYAGLCAVLFTTQRSFLYFPQPRAIGSDAPTITLSTDGADVLVSVRPHRGPNALVYFGGNGEDVSYSLPGFSAAFPDHAIYLMNYRGYGGSTGTPTEAALFADADALFDKVHAEHEHVLAVGRSLGSGVAVHLASVRPVSRLALVTPYNSIQELAGLRFPYFPVRWLLQDKFESWKYACQVSVPTILVAAEHDESIPRASTEALLASFPTGIASLRVLAGTTHNTITESSGYIPSLRGEPEG